MRSVAEADAALSRGAKAAAEHLLAGAKPTSENAFKLVLTDRAIGAGLAQAKG
jgi:xanthine dehydrogenase YagS FAD-binding subunit